jgi:hypothetical protein
VVLSTTPCHESKATGLAVARLADDLKAQGSRGPLALRFDLGTLHLEPLVVAVEGFPQSGQEHASQARFEPAVGTNRSRQGLSGLPCRTSFHSSHDVTESERRVENHQPGKSHQCNHRVRSCC